VLADTPNPAAARVPATAAVGRARALRQSRHERPGVARLDATGGDPDRDE
jgi:hypothetical protein